MAKGKNKYKGRGKKGKGKNEGEGEVESPTLPSVEELVAYINGPEAKRGMYHCTDSSIVITELTQAFKSATLTKAETVQNDHLAMGQRLMLPNRCNSLNCLPFPLMKLFVAPHKAANQT